MSHASFASRVAKLEKNVYETVKGRIRLSLLEQDLLDFCPSFSEGGMQILDVGGGSGRFARICAGRGHRVLLCDSSSDMLRRAEDGMTGFAAAGLIEPRLVDFLSTRCTFSRKFDLVAVHGSAEWMDDPGAAVKKACALVRPGGYLSLLVFNLDRLVFKRGINGLLLQEKNVSRKNTLTPPGAQSPAELRQLLDDLSGRILLQSGIRIFHKFFREGVDEKALTPEQWLQQERLYYRKEPFSALGEHTHLIWQAPC